VPKLKVKWAYAMAGGGMPTVVGDWLFISNRSGKTYALDAKTGCVHWALDIAARTTPMVIKSPISPSGWVTFVGERSRVVHALDAQTGKEIWKTEPLEKHPVAGITGTPIISGDRMFVPITSGEEGAARQPSYACCSFRGSLVAVDLKTGRKLWQTYVIREPLRNTKPNSAGTMMQGPAGGAIWSAPTVDAARGQVLVTTGDSYTVVDTKGADAIVAMDMKTGAIRWSTQVTEKDNFIVGCPVTGQRAANCPDPLGPDHDFGASPILFKTKAGKDVVLAGQKSGAVWGLDPVNGKVLWERRVGSGSTLGGIEWGMAADPNRLYVANSDIGGLMDELRAKQGLPLSKTGITGPAKPGLYAIDPATGAVAWSVPAPEAPCRYAGDRSRDRAPGACMRAQSAAPSTMPGVVFSGTMDGWFRAYDAATGRIIWADSTTSRTYDTVNAVKGQPGGSIDGMGPAIANGMVFTMSGFNGAANTGGNGVNVLLAYSVDGK
jgi:polyvinyl alcohol dehydrogenase (cytochrome)